MRRLARVSAARTARRSDRERMTRDDEGCSLGPAARKAGVEMSLLKRCGAETIGTFWLVFGGCGSAVLAAGFPHLGIGFAGVALAFGLTVLTMAYAIGHISGCHLNPAVTLGLVMGKRFKPGEALPYIVAQVI